MLRALCTRFIALGMIQPVITLRKKKTQTMARCCSDQHLSLCIDSIGSCISTSSIARAVDEVICSRLSLSLPSLTSLSARRPVESTSLTAAPQSLTTAGADGARMLPH